jgi:hypothetical protein
MLTKLEQHSNRLHNVATFDKKRQPPATFSQSFDTKWQVKAGTPLAPYPAFASAALISLSLLVFIH